jgi:hypothetical protein
VAVVGLVLRAVLVLVAAAAVRVGLKQQQD